MTLYIEELESYMHDQSEICAQKKKKDKTLAEDRGVQDGRVGGT